MTLHNESVFLFDVDNTRLGVGMHARREVGPEKTDSHSHLEIYEYYDKPVEP